VSRVPAPASPRDSQAAIPLSRMTGERVDHRHGLMDAAHHSRETGAHARLPVWRHTSGYNESDAS